MNFYRMYLFLHYFKMLFMSITQCTKSFSRGKLEDVIHLHESKINEIIQVGFYQTHSIYG